MTNLDDNELLDRFARKMSAIETQVADPPQWVAPNTRLALPIATTRFQSTFSATKFVVAGAIVALFGGLLLIAQPFDQRDGALPGARQSDESMAVAVFTGTMGCCFWTDGTLSETSEGFRQEVGATETGDLDVTDPRLSGLFTWTSTSLDVEGTMLYAVTAEVSNDGGRWIGTSTGAWGSSFEHQVAVVLKGMDDYEGLTAYLVNRGNAFAGVIFPGDMPSAPEPAQVDDPRSSGT